MVNVLEKLLAMATFPKSVWSASDGLESVFIIVVAFPKMLISGPEGKVFSPTKSMICISWLMVFPLRWDQCAAWVVEFK